MFWFLLLSLLFISHPFSVEIDKQNVFELIGKNKHVFVHFWADGCKHCLAFAPEWNELVRIYHGVDDIVLATINCDRFQSLCVAFDGSSTPGLQYFAPRERKGIQFGGEKMVLPMAKWVRQTTSIDPITKPNSLLFSKPDELKEILNDGWLLLAVDNPRKQFYNHSEIRNCEDELDVAIRSLSQTQYPEEAVKYCGKQTHCIILTNGKEKFEYKGDIETQLIFDFINSHIPSGDL